MKQPLTDSGKIAGAPWISDQGDGTYINPVLHADYSDPDVIRVNDDFYITSSSFCHIPGLPILHSKDLVNWRLINHAIKQMPLPDYDRVQHGKGVWAPSIRYHDEKFWFFYGDPDVGIFMTTADHPAGDWTPLHLVHEGKGLIDACPLWDDDGQAYLIHAFAESRSGIRHKLRVCRMSPDGTRLLDEGEIVFNDPEGHPTMEGPKFYKRNGYYYIFAPAGGVAEGWQTVLRASSPFGPYEDRIVLHQGDSPVNGPHQGGWVELINGESWFIHFQDKNAYGRIVHLQPVVWEDNWPLMGINQNAGIGEPAVWFQKPNVGAVYPIEIPATSDNFTAGQPGLQWQWQANPSPNWLLPTHGDTLRLCALRLPRQGTTFYDAPQLLLQKFPALSFRATVRLDIAGMLGGTEAGLIVFGYRHARLAAKVIAAGTEERELIYTVGNQTEERAVWRTPMTGNFVDICVNVRQDAYCDFAYSMDGELFKPVPMEIFEACADRWAGAKIGLFAIAEVAEGGYADFKRFQVDGIEGRTRF